MAATFNNPNSALPADIMTPGVGDLVYFFDISNGGQLSYMDNARVVTVVVSADGDCCSCTIAVDLMRKMGCAISDGLISITQFNTFVAAGMSITSTESEVDGVKTCTVTITTPA